MAAMKLRHLPNIITIMRVVLLVPLVYFLLQQSYVVALIIFMVAGASDGLDGYLAKKYQWQSRFGSIADPLADKLLMFISYGYLTYANLLPFWLFLLVVGRDIVIVTEALCLQIIFGPFEVRPTLTSKFNTMMQIFLVTYVMYSLVFTHIPVIIREILVVFVSITSITSGLQYLWLGYVGVKQKLQQQ